MKTNKEKFREKYWKLPAQERMHYDSKIKDVNKQYDSFFTFTRLSIYVMFYGSLLLILMSVFFQQYNQIFIGMGKQIAFLLFKLLPFIVLIDIIDIILMTNKKDKEKRKLAKRFKLTK